MARLLYTSWVLFLTLTPIHVYKIHEPEARAKRQAMCGPPEVKTGSLILNSEGTFPEQEYQKVKSNLSDEMQVILQQRNEAAVKHLELESNAVSRYPECMYNAMCNTSRKMVCRQRIKSDTENCWIIENVNIAECDLKLEHDFSCAKFEIPKAVGVGCFPSYFNRNVLAFCLGPPNKIVSMIIQIPNTCKAQSYECQLQK
ncbi:uncharacterized protein LOC132736587 [Ruditapes philippinarum]|uniref:uncharacterized protein LOC132736587 n=1 Tax=Ruditapes philippinarum TaxID=129788 RepID=UPI00295BBB94|nr:uncharacterized protein LOC132736587 [Ruditapes philippinarum]